MRAFYETLSYRGRGATLPEEEEHLKSLHRLERDQQKHRQDLKELKSEVKELHSLLLQLIQNQSKSGTRLMYIQC